MVDEAVFNKAPVGGILHGAGLKAPLQAMHAIPPWEEGGGPTGEGAAGAEYADYGQPNGYGAPQQQYQYDPGGY